jgi:hypothetical protein
VVLVSDGHRVAAASLPASLQHVFPYAGIVTISDKGRENRARRIAERRGYRLEKSRRRDPRATDYGRYQLIDAATGTVASIGGPWLTLHEAERQLDILSAVDEPNDVRLIQAVARLAMALSPLAGLDPRTMARLAGPVTAAANLLGEATIQDLATAAGQILDAPPVAPPDVMTIGPLLDEVKAAFRAYETSRGRLPRPVMDVPQVMSRFS